MLIGLCGGVCAGKSSIINFLVAEHDFQILTLDGAGGNIAIANFQFPDATALLDYATKHWKRNFVTSSLPSSDIADIYFRRPFFLLLHVDAPIKVRFDRYRARCGLGGTVPSLGEFVDISDGHLYSPHNSLATLAFRAQLKLLNGTDSLKTLYTALAALDLPNPDRLRPTWDHYFMTLASLAARRSNCMRRAVGCVLVRERRILATGYNGTPRNITNCNTGGCPRCNGGPSTAAGAALNTCLCIHAEENALLEAGRDRVGGGAVLYCNTCPCLTCSIKIVQVGIKEVVYSQSYHMDAASARVFAEAGVKLRQFLPPREGVVNLMAAEKELVLPFHKDVMQEVTLRDVS